MHHAAVTTGPLAIITSCIVYGLAKAMRTLRALHRDVPLFLLKAQMATASLIWRTLSPCAPRQCGSCPRKIRIPHRQLGSCRYFGVNQRCAPHAVYLSGAMSHRVNAAHFETDAICRERRVTCSFLSWVPTESVAPWTVARQATRSSRPLSLAVMMPSVAPEHPRGGAGLSLLGVLRQDRSASNCCRRHMHVDADASRSDGDRSDSATALQLQQRFDCKPIRDATPLCPSARRCSFKHSGNKAR